MERDFHESERIGSTIGAAAAIGRFAAGTGHEAGEGSQGRGERAGFCDSMAAGVEG